MATSVGVDEQLSPHEIGMRARREAQAKYADRGLVAQALMAFYAYVDARWEAEQEAGAQNVG